MTTCPDNKTKGTGVTTLPADGDIDMSGHVVTNVTYVNDIKISTADIDSYFVNNPGYSWSITSTPFEDYLPPLPDVLEMCEEYPGLAKAYENFKTAYQLVEQDWKGKKK